MLYRSAIKHGWCPKSPWSGLPLQSKSIGSDHQAPVSKTTNAESDASQSSYATHGTRRFDEWWDNFRHKPSLNSSLAREIAWCAWSAAHKKLGASMADDNLPNNAVWLCQGGVAYEGPKPLVRMDNHPETISETDPRVWGVCWGSGVGYVRDVKGS